MSDKAEVATIDLDAIRKRLEATTPGPWGYNSYSKIDSAPLAMQCDNTETPDYPEGPRPGRTVGHVFFDDADNAWLAQQHAAYEADPVIAWVPAEYGDTATGRHAADAEFIGCSRTDVPALLTEVERLRAALQRIKDNEGKVCAEFELCRHVACQSSVAAWMIADATLAGDKANYV